MYIEILSVSKKKEQDTLPDREDELRLRLAKYGFTLNAVKKTIMHPTLINSALNGIASAEDKPDVVIIANALRTKDASSFKKYFVETVAAAERGINEPAPKDYWKRRNRAFAQAKAAHADEQRMAELEKEYTLTRKKTKVFSLGQFGEGYRGYCFIYKGVRVAVVPKAELTGSDFGEVAALAAVRTAEIFESSANEFPEGFGTQEYIPAKTGFVNQFIPLRGDSGKEVGRKIVVIAAFCVFLAALGLLFYNMIFLSIKNTQLNGEIQRIAHRTVSEEEEDHAPDVEEGIDWDELQSINPEIVGWIYINDTKIDYPVLWHKGDDMYSQYYLNHNYRGDWDSYGTIFLDYRCLSGTDSKNVVMHGHHMNDGSMFGNLMNYAGMSGNLDFYEEAPVVEFDTPKANGKYKIISIYKTNTLSSQGEFFNYLRADFQNEKDFMNYVYDVRVRSLINCPVDVNEDDELITLSTCSYEFTNFRTVVVARRVRIGEKAEVDTSKASINDNAVWPEVYYNAYGGTRPKVTDFVTAYENKEIDWYDGKLDFKDQKVTGTTDEDDETTAGSTKKGTTAQPTTELRIFHTVTFINYDGSEISTQEVEDGLSADPPADPVKPSDEYFDYVFKGWQLDFNVVQSDMTIAPNFEAVRKPAESQ